MSPVRVVLIALIGAAGLAAGCGTTPEPAFYTLATEAGGASAQMPAISVIVGPVTLPEAVDRPQLVISAAGNRVQIEEFHRWAEPLKTGISRAVAMHLGRQLGTSRAGIFSDVTIGDPDYRVLIDMQRFESRPGEAATVEALWTVRSRDGRDRTGHTLAREAVTDGSYDALIAAHGRALALVSRDVGDAIRMLQR
ncbi:MAG: hypothetical protein AMJ67_17215 [Betaproteobacteria bacterium SG8_41]|nr:MAG: hypothetical protein AMJ67_17215 [Betaproteobacteria bacterium SG8_41]